jgi:hypothetical protein
MLLSLIIQIGIALSFDSVLFIVMAVEAIYFLTILFGRPYASILHKLGAIMCFTPSFSALALALLRQVYFPSEDIEVLLVFCLKGLVILAQLMTIVRLIKVCYGLLSSLFKRNHEKTASRDTEVLRRMINREELLEV